VLVVEAAVVKTSKYAVSESGDTVELVERPRGGISLIMADGQRSGRSAKALSSMVARKAASLLAEGVRDGAAARAASDYLRASRHGQVSADMVILSGDLETGTLVVTRNIACPVLMARHGDVTALDQPAPSLGIERLTRPQITEMPIEPGIALVAFTDGVWEAGLLSTRPTRTPDWILDGVQGHDGLAQEMADELLERAVALDGGRPRDDMTVVVVATRTCEEPLDVRRLHVIFPIRGLS